MNAPVLRVDAPLPVRILTGAADDFGRELEAARKKLALAEQEVRRIEKAQTDVIAGIKTLGATYDPPPKVSA